MNRPDRAAIHAAMTTKGYRLFENAKGFDLNIVGIRSASTVPDRFDDWITVSYRDGVAGDWAFYAWPGTTDPGLYYLRRPLNVHGTAILKPGQYRSSHAIRKHQGRYEAVCQKPGTNLPVHRDRNEDGTIDLDAEVMTNGTGINIHRAGDTRASTVVGKWSAGCQVFADPTDFDVFMTLARRGRDIYGNGFTYTLLEDGDL
ncbi:hypothetical protein [Hyphobacterium marinum]|uniref:Uncharacterized protein n=1 Tax=Hyphobacterium marinum TaxID=3116574 RepID=A0ABU7M0V9_9PROT|nr:hypothetical protein [Hyphobacterium sp. Y6023]MEE2567444.1 hypothetical protein [Hyphobacterium sp. Y6023]